MGPAGADLQFLAVTTFGTVDDAQQAVDLVRRIHDAVTGTMPDGSTYAASDPHLLAWVHAAEVDSFLRSHQVYGSTPLDQAGRDAYVAQAGRGGRRLGVVDPPSTEAELAAALAAYRPELRGTPEAREAVFDVLWRPPLPLAARPAYAMLRTAAIAMMPDWSREPLGLPSRPLLDRTVPGGWGTSPPPPSAGHCTPGTPTPGPARPSRRHLTKCVFLSADVLFSRAEVLVLARRGVGFCAPRCAGCGTPAGLASRRLTRGATRASARKNTHVGSARHALRRARTHTSAGKNTHFGGQEPHFVRGRRRPRSRGTRRSPADR